MRSVPVLRFTYAYVTTGELASETIEVEATNERDAHAKARAKLDRNGLRSIGLRLLESEPTGSVRSVA